MFSRKKKILSAVIASIATATSSGLLSQNVSGMNPLGDGIVSGATNAIANNPFKSLTLFGTIVVISNVVTKQFGKSPMEGLKGFISVADIGEFAGVARMTRAQLVDKANNLVAGVDHTQVDANKLYILANLLPDAHTRLGVLKLSKTAFDLFADKDEVIRLAQQAKQELKQKLAKEKVDMVDMPGGPN